MNPAIKYRPSLTLDELQFILTHPHISSQPALAAKLNTFILKAQHGITKPSHVATGSPSLQESLGFTTTPQPQSPQSIQTLLTIYESTPSILSPSQLAQVQHHRYINDMMSPEEESQYEQL
jgi:hypothetical protein